MIRLLCTDRATPVMLDFGTAFEDRDAIRDVLNRRLTPAGAADAANASRAQATPTTPAATRAETPGVDWMKLTVEERKWRQSLMQKKEVISLHRSLVASSIVDDEKFWKGMRCKYKPNGQRKGATAAELELTDDGGSRQGVPSAAFIPVDADATKDIPINWVGDTPSAGERHRIFMDHPAVSLAYRAKVLDAPAGARMSDTSFWGVYKQSSMAQKHVKGTKRAAAVATEADAMFAEYHAQEDLSVKAAEQKRATAVDLSLNMDRFDDHRQVHVMDAYGSGDAPETAKRRQGQRNAAAESRGLELMRKLNMHGTMVLDGVTISPTRAWREDDDTRAHPLRDLEGRAAPVFTKLALENEEAFLAAHSSGGRTTNSDPGVSTASANDGEQEKEICSLQNAARLLHESLVGWVPSSQHLENKKNNKLLDGLLRSMKP
jgi:hypothetical protein